MNEEVIRLYGHSDFHTRLISFKIKKYSGETIARCEFAIQHAQKDVNNLREEAEKAMLLFAKEVEK